MEKIIIMRYTLLFSIQIVVLSIGGLLIWRIKFGKNNPNEENRKEVILYRSNFETN